MAPERGHGTGHPGRSMIGVFGGSGLYRLLDEPEELAISTPYGDPSAPVRVGELDGVRVAFMLRHGDAHHLPPHRVNYRANVWAMREAGVRRIVGPSACGSLRRELAPGTFVVADQFVDRTMDGPTPSTTVPRPPTCGPRTPTARVCGGRWWRRPASWTSRSSTAARWW